MNGYLVKWYGPYDDDTLVQNDTKNCLYLITGKKKHQRNQSILYCGITKRTVSDRVNDKNHKSWNVVREIQYWVGVVDYSRKPSEYLLRKLEHILIYFLKTEENSQNKDSLPKRRMILVNQWYRPDGIRRKNQIHEAQKLQDLIFFSENEWLICNTLKIPKEK